MSYEPEIERGRALELIDKFAKFFVERRLGAAAIMAFESLKPLAGIGSQALYMVTPFLDVFFGGKEINEVALLLENREYVDLFIKRLDEIDEEFYREERRKARILRSRRRKIRKEKFNNLMKKIKIFKK